VAGAALEQTVLKSNFVSVHKVGCLGQSRQKGATHPEQPEGGQKHELHPHIKDYFRLRQLTYNQIPQHTYDDVGPIFRSNT
jgi:hypothetical protein